MCIVLTSVCVCEGRRHFRLRWLSWPVPRSSLLDRFLGIMSRCAIYEDNARSARVCVCVGMSLSSQLTNESHRPPGAASSLKSSSSCPFLSLPLISSIVHFVSICFKYTENMSKFIVFATTTASTTQVVILKEKVVPAKNGENYGARKGERD